MARTISIKTYGDIKSCIKLETPSDDVLMNLACQYFQDRRHLLHKEYRSLNASNSDRETMIENVREDLAQYEADDVVVKEDFLAHASVLLGVCGHADNSDARTTFGDYSKLKQCFWAA
jgi:hypothetical protein